MDARVGHTDSARTPHLQAEAALRSLQRAPRLRVFQEPWSGREKETSMTRDEFRALVDEALLLIPENFREAMQNIAIVVEDEPSARALADVGLEPPDTLLGLYEGTPLTERQWAHG